MKGGGEAERDSDLRMVVCAGIVGGWAFIQMRWMAINSDALGS